MRRIALVVGLLLIAPGCAEERSRAAAPERGSDPAEFAPVGGATAARTAQGGRWQLARVLRRTQLRRSPGGGVLARIGRKTEWDSPRVLHVVGERRGWLRVVATELPNGRRGWIPSSATRRYRTRMSIRVDRSARRLELRRDRRVVVRMPVAVGRPGTPTPLGRFSVTDKLHPEQADSPYGCCIVALSGRQPKLVPGWIGGDRLAIHATPSTWTIGKRASLGCLRGHARDLRRLMARVPLGTPVFIRR